jgi:hypothetical protein
MIVTRDKNTGRTSKIVSEIFQDNDATLSLKLSKIETGNRVYLFNYPVLFQISQEGNGTIIESEQLDIYAAGKTITEAKNELSNQFDHSYGRLNELNDDQLSQKLLLVKEYLNFIIKTVSNK